jgi:hypothetical protein
MKSIVQSIHVYDLPYIAEPSRTVFNHIDLRRNPSQISTIPELKDQPVLKSLVEALNDKDGMFMTHGSAAASRRPDGIDVVIPSSEASAAATHWFSSYVTFSFWRFSQNQNEQYQILFEEFNPVGNGSDICFVIQPAYFRTLFEERFGAKWGIRNATICLIWVSGWGGSAAIAHSRWRNAVKGLIEFFRGFKWIDGQTDSGITVSDLLLSQDPKPPSWAS